MNKEEIKPGDVVYLKGCTTEFVAGRTTKLGTIEIYWFSNDEMKSKVVPFCILSKVIQKVKYST